MTPDHPTSIRLSPEIKRALVKMCRKQGCSITFKIQDIIRKHIFAMESAARLEEEQ